MKEWMRTPQTLLLDYCTMNKRPRPRYDGLDRARDGSGKRYRVVLQDTKRPGTDKDLLFMTDRGGGDDDDDAKHTVALLALHSLEPDRPHERKLPEPYRSLWLGLVAASGAKAAIGVPSASLEKAPVHAKLKVAVAVAVAVAEGGTSSIVTSPAAAPTPPTPSPYVLAADSASSARGSPAVLSIPLPPAPSLSPPAPPALTRLVAAGSVADARKGKVERETRIRERKNKREAKLRQLLQAAGNDAVLMMSSASRAAVETVLRQVRGGGAGAGEDDSGEESGGDPIPDNALGEDEGGGGVPRLSTRALLRSLRLDAASRSTVEAELVTLGFTAAQAARGAVAGFAAAARKEILQSRAAGRECDAASVAAALSARAVADASLDELILWEPESALPAAFDPRGKVSEFRKISAAVLGEGEGGGGDPGAASLPPVRQRRILGADAASLGAEMMGGDAVTVGAGWADAAGKLGAWGVLGADAAAACLRGESFGCVPCAFIAAAPLAARLHTRVLSYLARGPLPPTDAPEEAAAGEIEACQAIYGIDFTFVDGPFLSAADVACVLAGLEVGVVVGAINSGTNFVTRELRINIVLATGIRAKLVVAYIAVVVAAAVTTEVSSSVELDPSITAALYPNSPPQAWVEPMWIRKVDLPEGAGVGAVVAVGGDSVGSSREEGTPRGLAPTPASVSPADSASESAAAAEYTPPDAGTRLCLAMHLAAAAAARSEPVPFVFDAAGWLEAASPATARVPPISLRRTAAPGAGAAVIIAAAAVATRGSGRGSSLGVKNAQSRGGGALSRAPRPSAALSAIMSRDDLALTARSRAPPTPALLRMNKVRAALPVASFKASVLEALAASQVVLLSGGTGCGKTTQVPQFILEDAIARGTGGHTRIICTQPRRLAATGVAARVAAERDEPLGVAGGSVGYHIKGERRAHVGTSLLFCTTGILLRRLAGGLGHCTHIIVDEVHERSVDTDFLLAVLRRVLAVRRDVKVLLMSATMDAGAFAAYFADKDRPAVPTLDVPGFTHPVEDVYLEQVLELTKYRPTMAKERLGEGGESGPDLRSWKSHGLDYGLVAATVQLIVNGGGGVAAAKAACEVDAGLGEAADGAVLVFMPGVAEIRRLARDLERGGLGRIHLLQLHGQLSPADQARVFERAPRGLRKVIISTNVAETSITIDDVTVVVDPFRVKEAQYDALNNVGKLVEVWTSQAASKQRRGRSGRTRPGVAYRLIPRATLETLAPNTTPEIARTPLDDVILQILALRLGPVGPFLQALLTPPPPRPSPALSLRSQPSAPPYPPQTATSNYRPSVCTSRDSAYRRI